MKSFRRNMTNFVYPSYRHLGLIRRRGDTASGHPAAVTVEADDKAAAVTDPVEVEEGRQAYVAHLADADDRFFPGDQRSFGQRLSRVSFLQYRIELDGKCASVRQIHHQEKKFNPRTSPPKSSSTCQPLYPTQIGRMIVRNLSPTYYWPFWV